jgi:hypothetical protein
MIIDIEYRCSSTVKEHFNTLNIAFSTELEDFTIPGPSPNTIKDPSIEGVV